MRILYAKIDQFCENILTNSNYTLIIKLPSKILKKEKSRVQKLFSLVGRVVVALFCLCASNSSGCKSWLQMAYECSAFNILL